MGFIKDLRSISKQSKELGARSDPGASFREMNERLQHLNGAMQQTTATLTAPPADARAGHVTVVSVGRRSGTMNGDPAIVLSVLVSEPGRPPVPATAMVVVPLPHVHRVQPGAVIPAHLDAADPIAFALDWRPAAGAG